MKKYYFIVYECKHKGWNPNGISTGSYTKKSQQFINIHPVQWQVETNEKYEPQHDSGGVGYTASEHYLILNWIEVNKDEYEKFKDDVG